MKQYMPMKPIKQGIEVWECTEASSWLMCNFQVHMRKKHDGMVATTWAIMLFSI